jgi:hypothetical protein
MTHSAAPADDDFDYAVTWTMEEGGREGVEEFRTRAEAEAWMAPEKWATLPPDGFHLVYRTRWTRLVDGERPTPPTEAPAAATGNPSAESSATGDDSAGAMAGSGTAWREYAIDWPSGPPLTTQTAPLSHLEATQAIAEFPDDAGVLHGRDVTVSEWTPEST